MRLFLLNLFVVGLFAAAYFTNIFAWLTSGYVLFGAFVLIVVLFVLAFRIVGIPFVGIADEDEKKKPERVEKQEKQDKPSAKEQTKPEK